MQGLHAEKCGCALGNGVSFSQRMNSVSGSSSSCENWNPLALTLALSSEMHSTSSCVSMSGTPMRMMTMRLFILGSICGNENHGILDAGLAPKNRPLPICIRGKIHQEGPHIPGPYGQCQKSNQCSSCQSCHTDGGGSEEGHARSCDGSGARVPAGRNGTGEFATIGFPAASSGDHAMPTGLVGLVTTP